MLGKNHPDPDAVQRQAITKISNSLMSLMHMEGSLSEPQLSVCKDVIRDLTRARFMLVEHEDPDNILDELSQL